jgi:PHD/YefM family antitoxin component YafN of YafNO toxin-antitoxin module
MERFTKTDLTQKVARVFRATFNAPVIIMDRGEDSHVLMTVERYREMVEKLEAMEAEKQRPAMVLPTPEQG